jgi:hypothetical protein
LHKSQLNIFLVGLKLKYNNILGRSLYKHLHLLLT